MIRKSQLVETALKIAKLHSIERKLPILSKASGLSRSYLQHFASERIINPGASQVESILRAVEHPLVVQIDLLCPAANESINDKSDSETANV